MNFDIGESSGSMLGTTGVCGMRGINVGSKRLTGGEADGLAAARAASVCNELAVPLETAACGRDVACDGEPVAVAGVAKFICCGATACGGSEETAGFTVTVPGGATVATAGLAVTVFSGATVVTAGFAVTVFGGATAVTAGFTIDGATAVVSSGGALADPPCALEFAAHNDAR